MRELWEEYVGGEMPEDLLKKERLDKELMQIGKHEHLKQLDESREFERSGPTFRMMRRGKPAERREWWEEYFFSKGGSGREDRENRTVRLTTKESASSSKWLESEGLTSYAEAAVMFEGATDAVEKENELLRKQWPEGNIERVARFFKVSLSESPASATQTSESVVVGPKSILKSSDVKVMKCFRNGLSLIHI